MTIFQQIQELGLPTDTYVIVGSGTLVALGLLPSNNDVDMCVTPDTYDSLKGQGWKEVFEPKPVLKHDVGVGFGDWRLADLQSDALIIKGIPFMRASRKFWSGNGRHSAPRTSRTSRLSRNTCSLSGLTDRHIG